MCGYEPGALERQLVVHKSSSIPDTLLPGKYDEGKHRTCQEISVCQHDSFKSRYEDRRFSADRLPDQNSKIARIANVTLDWLTLLARKEMNLRLTR